MLRLYIHPYTPQSALKPGVRCASSGALWGNQNKTKNKRWTSLHYLPAPTTLQTLHPLPKPQARAHPAPRATLEHHRCTLHTPPRKPTRRHPFRPRVHRSLSCTTPRKSRTLPAGYLPGRLRLSLAGTSDPVAAWSRVRSAVLLAHSPNFHRLLHWGSPGEPDPPLKRSVTHGEGRGRH